MEFNISEFSDIASKKKLPTFLWEVLLQCVVILQIRIHS